MESGRRRLAFEELLLLQLKLLLRRSIEKSPRSEEDLKGIRVEMLTMMNAGKKQLGFDLTRAQDRVLKEVCTESHWVLIPSMQSAKPVKILNPTTFALTRTNT